MRFGHIAGALFCHRLLLVCCTRQDLFIDALLDRTDDTDDLLSENRGLLDIKSVSSQDSKLRLTKIPSDTLNIGLLFAQAVSSFATFVLLLVPQAFFMQPDEITADFITLIALCSLMVAFGNVSFEIDLICADNSRVPFLTSSWNAPMLVYFVSRVLFVSLPSTIFALLVSDEPSGPDLILSGLYSLLSIVIGVLLHNWFAASFNRPRKQLREAFRNEGVYRLASLNSLPYPQEGEFYFLLQEVSIHGRAALSQFLEWANLQAIKPSYHLYALNQALKGRRLAGSRAVLIKHLLAHFGRTKDGNDMALIRRYPLVARIVEAQSVFVALSLFLDEYNFMPELRDHTVRMMLLSPI